MKIGLGIGSARRGIGGGGIPVGTIEGTPVILAAADTGDTLDDVVTWGVMVPTSGTLLTPTREMRVDAGSWASYLGSTALAYPEVWEVRETHSSTSGATRTDTAGPMSVVGYPPSTFPQIISHADTVSSAAATSATINIPPGYAAGDVLLALVGIDGNATVTHSGGWTLVSNDAAASSYRRLIFTKVAAGSDTLSLTLSASERTDAKVLALSTGAVLSYSVISATNNPPNLTYGASADTLWIATITHDGTSSHAGTGSAPTGYSFIGSIAQGSATSAGVGVHMASREATAATEDPDGFSASGSNANTQLIGVRF